MVEHESAEEDVIHSMHDEPFVESELEDHFEAMIEDDEQPSFVPVSVGHDALHR